MRVIAVLDKLVSNLDGDQMETAVPAVERGPERFIVMDAHGFFAQPGARIYASCATFAEAMEYKGRRQDRMVCSDGGLTATHQAGDRIPFDLARTYKKLGSDFVPLRRQA